MGKLVRRIIEDLNNAKTFEDLEPFIWKASDLLVRGSSSGYRSGFEEIDREDVTAAERDQIQQAFLDALDRNSDPRWVTTILSMLSVGRDPSLKDFWFEHLRKSMELLKTANSMVYSSLSALENLGEPVFEQKTYGRSLAEVDQTISAAHKYLHKHGVDVPW